MHTLASLQKMMTSYLSGFPAQFTLMEYQSERAYASATRAVPESSGQLPTEKTGRNNQE